MPNGRLLKAIMQEPDVNIFLPEESFSIPEPLIREILAGGIPEGNADTRNFAADFDRLVVHNDNHLLVIRKPPGLLSQKASADSLSINEIGMAWRKIREEKPGRVFLSAAHRLDRFASGLLLMAKTDKAASRLADMFRHNRVEKTYRVLTAIKLPEEQGTLSGRYEKKQMPNRDYRMRPAATGELLSLNYALVRAASHPHPVFLYEIGMETGRFHQIRALFSSAGAPLLGDTKYNGPLLRGVQEERFALFATRLQLEHPVNGEQLDLHAQTDWELVLRAWSGCL